MGTLETPKEEKITEDPKKEVAGSQETNWTSFVDFKRDFTSLAERTGINWKEDKKIGSISGRAEKSELPQDSPERKKWAVVKALSWFYQNLGGVVIPGSFYVPTRKDAKTFASDLYREINDLWNRRYEQIPLPLRFSKEKDFVVIEEDALKRKDKFDAAKKELEDLAAKMKVMRGKKRERFERSVYEPTKYNLRHLEEGFKYSEERLRSMLRAREVEFGFREGLNHFLPRLNGVEYFEIQLQAVSEPFGFFLLLTKNSIKNSKPLLKMFYCVGQKSIFRIRP